MSQRFNISFSEENLNLIKSKLNLEKLTIDDIENIILSYVDSPDIQIKSIIDGEIKSMEMGRIFTLKDIVDKFDLKLTKSQLSSFGKKVSLRKDCRKIGIKSRTAIYEKIICKESWMTIRLIILRVCKDHYIEGKIRG